MTALRLTRSRAKHPPSKTVVEAQRIKSKVKKSEIKNRRNLMDPRQQRLAQMDREIEDLKRERLADRQQFLTEKDARVASEVDERANRIMQAEGIDYSAAVRRAVAESDHFTSPDESAQSAEPMADAMARRMLPVPHTTPTSRQTTRRSAPPT